MAVSVARDTIACPKCGSRRVVSNRQVRFARQKGGIPCASCRGAVRPVKDEDLRFWLRRFGVNAPRGVPVRDFITAGGAPRELVVLAQETFPDEIPH
jgi:hypothetical protein